MKASIADGVVGLGKWLLRIDRSAPWTIVKREALCSVCPERVRERCGNCGCLIYAKVRVAGESCPIGRW